MGLSKSILGLLEVLFKGLDLLLTHRIFMFKLCYVLTSLSLFFSGFVLLVREFLLVPLLLVSELLLVVLHRLVVALDGPFPLFLEPPLQSIPLDLEEGLKLAQLLLALRLHLCESGLELTRLLL